MGDPRSSQPSKSTATERDCILCIDDDDDVVMMLGAILGRHYEVLSATDAETALAMVRERLPALVLSDVMMPHISGFELVRIIKADPDTRHIPVVLLTGRGGIGLKLEGFEQGADDYIQKPFESRELLARIRALLENGRLARQLTAKNKELERVLGELKRTQECLLEAERTRTALSMASALAHEINNPLSGILGFCDLLRSSFQEGSDEHHDVERIVEQASRIADVVKKITSLKEVRFVPYVGDETMVDLNLQGGDDAGSVDG